MIVSQRLYNSLIDKGLVERKSLKLKFPSENIIPHHLQRHFIRGYFDGDGSLTIRQRKCMNYKAEFGVKLCGTEHFLTNVVRIFNENIQDKMQLKLYKRFKNNKDNYSIDSASLKRNYEICRFLYEDCSIYLDRKYERYNLLKQAVNSRA